jgi:hypothetical protein
LGTAVKGHGRKRVFVDAELKDVGAGVVAHHVEIELPASDLAGIEAGEEDALPVPERSRQTLPGG